MHTNRTGALLGFLMVFAVLVVNSALTVLNLYRLQRNNDLVEHSHEILLELRAVLGSVSAAEAGQRGFLITGEPEYLEPYQNAMQTVYDEMNRLQRLTATDPQLQAEYATLERVVDHRLDLIRENVETREEQGPTAAQLIMYIGQGRAAMDAVRDQIEQMHLLEERRLANRIAETQTSYWTALITSLITAALGLGLVAVGFLLVRRDIDLRERAATALREANDRLEDRVRERTGAISRANEALRDEIETRRQTEQKLQILAEELRRSNRELEQFASVASHDLQEPLRKIQAFGDRLHLRSVDQLDEKGQDYLNRMLASAGRMRKLIDDLLTYSRVATRAQGFVPVNLSEVVEEVVGDLEDRLQQSQGRIEVGPLPTIEAEPVQMRQLFQNLLANGLKFRRADVPPVVTVTSRLISLAAEENGELSACEIRVADNGIGFDPAYADRIFELFQRLHGRQEYEGTGMGLAISRKIVERHGGRIVASGAPGEGACFTIVLPLRQSASSVPLDSTTGATP